MAGDTVCHRDDTCLAIHYIVYIQEVEEEKVTHSEQQHTLIGMQSQPSRASPIISVPLVIQQQQRQQQQRYTPGLRAGEVRWACRLPPGRGRQDGCARAGQYGHVHAGGCLQE